LEAIPTVASSFQFGFNEIDSTFFLLYEQAGIIITEQTSRNK